jgi:hypothetical protein
MAENREGEKMNGKHDLLFCTDNVHFSGKNVNTTKTKYRNSIVVVLQ